MWCCQLWQQHLLLALFFWNQILFLVKLKLEDIHTVHKTSLKIAPWIRQDCVVDSCESDNENWDVCSHCCVLMDDSRWLLISSLHSLKHCEQCKQPFTLHCLLGRSHPPIIKSTVFLGFEHALRGSDVQFILNHAHSNWFIAVIWNMSIAFLRFLVEQVTMSQTDHKY